ncbi:MAG: hypothetical protein NWR36_03360, partial [Opitutales bacterium]|nr:hypothetical protein [Opitutales bacterium]
MASALARIAGFNFGGWVILSKTDFESVTKVKCGQPHGILGMHPHKKGKTSGLVVRAFVDDAVSCEVVDLSDPQGARYPLERLSDEGFFEGVIKNRKDVFAYRLRIERYNGEIRQFYDPYSFLPTLSDDDVYLFSEGTDHQVHNKMGGHLREI